MNADSACTSINAVLPNTQINKQQRTQSMNPAHNNGIQTESKVLFLFTSSLVMYSFVGSFVSFCFVPHSLSFAFVMRVRIVAVSFGGVGLFVCLFVRSFVRLCVRLFHELLFGSFALTKRQSTRVS
jgi:hypothetical protein